MSRTNKENDRIPNPSEKYLKWSSDNKSFYYWDKNANDGDGAEVLIPENTPFIILDMLNCCVGYDEKLDTPLRSNEVRNIKAHAFRLYAGRKEVAHGVWEDIKGHSGVKFAKSVYAMAKIDGEFRLVNIKMSGAACGAWFDFVKDHGGERKLYGDVVIAQVGSEEGKKGKVTYYRPVFEIISRKLSDEAREMADRMDAEELQPYIKSYFESQGKESVEEAEVTETEEVEEAEDDEEAIELPF